MLRQTLTVLLRRDHSAHAIICKRVTCLPPSPWHSSNKARIRPRPHSSILSRRILCTYQNRPLRQAHHTDISVTLEHPLHHYSSHTPKATLTRMFLYTPDSYDKTSTVSHHQCTSPRTVISSMFLTFPHGGSMAQPRNWACNLARVLYKQAKTTSNKMYHLEYAHNAYAR